MARVGVQHFKLVCIPRPVIIAGLLWALAATAATGAGPTEMALFQVRPDKAAALGEAAAQVGLKPVAGPRAITAALPALVVWELSEKPELSEAWADALGEYVRRGGALLLSLSRRPGVGPMRLAAIAPTTGWHPFGAEGENRHGPLRLAEADETFFGGKAEAVALEVPFYHEIRPFHGVERGQARYDRFERPVPWQRYKDPSVKAPTLPPDSNWWSRPLLNRDWQIRARGDDGRGSPLLLTGRYGAGRVAVLASSLENLPGGAGPRRFFAAVLKWLMADGRTGAAAAAVVKLSPPKTQVDLQRRVLMARFENPGRAALPVEIVARVLTWEPALVNDVRQAATLPAGGAVDVEIPLPARDRTSYQALSDRDAFRVRLGALSADGAELLVETPVDVDLRPPVRLRLATAEVRSVTLPFEAPPPGMPNRMGLPVMAYAWAPGQEVEAAVTIDNGLRNLAPLAQVSDEADPHNATLQALTDNSALGERRPDWYALDAHGCYEGPKDAPCVLSFTFREPVWLAAVTVMGSADTYRNYHRHNPTSVGVELDGHEVAREAKAAGRLLEEHGLLRLPFSPRKAKTVRLRMPCLANGKPESVWLGEIYLEGNTTPPRGNAKGTLAVVLQNSLTGETRRVAQQAVSVGPLGRTQIALKTRLPQDQRACFYRLLARFTAGEAVQDAEVPLLAVNPRRPLAPMTKLQSNDRPSLGFIVTRGFRNVLETGTGTAEELGGWGQPDDLVWAYERGLKQLGPRTRTEAGRLYVSENDMRHYSSPWKQFYNGEEFFDVGAPLLVERMKSDRRWANSDQVTFGFSDRWDMGPSPGSMHGWQDFEGFHAWLQAQGQPGLRGRTRREIAAEIHTQYEGLWNKWHLDRFLHALAQLRDGFARAGKRLVITAQGMPMVPGRDAATLGDVERGMSDDSTWGLAQESISLTTARQMSALAFTPSLQTSTLLHWGYNSAVLGNCQWRGAIGTTEPSRRHLYDRAFRGTLRADGSYTSMHVYGFNSNAGEGFTLTSEDLDARQRVQDLHSLLTPEGPLGAGIVLSTAPRAEPAQMRFDCGDAFALPEARDLAVATAALHDAGVSIAFSANAACLAKWQGSAPLILTNLAGFSDAEVASLQALAQRGVRMAALVDGQRLLPAAAALFGVTADGAPAGGAEAGKVGGRTIVARGPCLLVPLAAGHVRQAEARAIAPLLEKHLGIPIHFPAGTCGYGFVSNGRRFVVLEDWREEARVAALEIVGREDWKGLRAIDVNCHGALKTRRNGDVWTIDVPLRPGDGVLVALEVER